MAVDVIFEKGILKSYGPLKERVGDPLVVALSKLCRKLDSKQIPNCCHGPVFKICG